MEGRAPQMFAGKRRSRQGRTAPRRVSLCMAFSLAVLSLWPALAVACPPILKSVTVPPNGNHPTSLWSLPSNVTSQFVQTSASSDVNEDGYFRSLLTFNTVDPGQTAFLDPFDFAPGVYYLHVAGHDNRCRGGVCPPIQFSDVMSFDVGAPAAATSAVSSSLADRAVNSAAIDCSGGGGGGAGPALPSTTGGPGPDKVRPLENLSFAPVQDIDKLFVKARMSEAGSLHASATVSTSGASKVYRFKTVSRSVAANVFTKLRLKLAKKNLKAVKRALKKRKRLKAKITITAVDKSKNKRSQKATIRLKN
jgi:hypothetical protein